MGAVTDMLILSVDSPVSHVFSVLMHDNKNVFKLLATRQTSPDELKHRFSVIQSAAGIVMKQCQVVSFIPSSLGMKKNKTKKERE